MRSLHGLTTLATLTFLSATSLQAATVELRPGILVDAEAGRAYLMRPEGGVEALSLQDGKVLFVSASGGTRPLAAAGGWLVSLAGPVSPGRLDLAFVSLTEPSRVATLSWPLPVDVRAIPVNGLGRSFEVIARSRGGSLDLAWTARWQRTSPLPPEEGEEQLGETRGGVRVDLASLTASLVTYDEAANNDDGPVPSSLATFVLAPGPFGPPVKAGGTWAVVETVWLTPSRTRLVLRRVGPDGKALEAKTLYEGAAVVQIPSADRRHVLVGAMDERNRARFDWSLFSLETGEPAGLLGGTTSHAAFHVLSGGNVGYETRAEERMKGTTHVESKRGFVVALPDGTVVFRSDVRENEYSGPFPP
jgi:hypothetical protein